MNAQPESDNTRTFKFKFLLQVDEDVFARIPQSEKKYFNTLAICMATLLLIGFFEVLSLVFQVIYFKSYGFSTGEGQAFYTTEYVLICGVFNFLSIFFIHRITNGLISNDRSLLPYLAIFLGVLYSITSSYYITAIIATVPKGFGHYHLFSLDGFLFFLVVGALPLAQMIIFIILLGTFGILFFSYGKAVAAIKSTGLYVVLRREKEKNDQAKIEKEKERILSDFKTDNAIKQTKSALEQLIVDNKINDESVNDLLQNIQGGNDVKSLISIADIEIKSGNFEKALEYINKAIEIEFENPELWRRKAELFGFLRRVTEAAEAQKLYTEFYTRESFKNNLTKAIYLTEVELKNLRFYGSFVWQLKSHINILLGKNGFGKSHLLSIILTQLQAETPYLCELAKFKPSSNSSGPNASGFQQITMEEKGTDVWDEVDKLEAEISELEKKNEKHRDRELELRISNLKRKTGQLKGSYFDNSGTIESRFGKVPVLAIPDSRFINKNNSSTIPVTDERAKKVLEHGAIHFIQQIPYENAIQNFLNTICALYLETRSFDDEIFILINRVFRKLTHRDFGWNDIKPTEDRSSYIITVTSEGNQHPLPLQKVSQGTLSVLSIIGLIFHYLTLRYPTVTRSELSKQQAIVVIDEIDAHLHPGWQQKIIGILREEFPNIQFIISAHSPLVVAGCLEGEVSVLRQQPEGFTIEQFEESFIGLSVAEIFTKVFEIEDRDENYIKFSQYTPEQIQQLEDQKETLLKKHAAGSDAVDAQSLSNVIAELNHVHVAKSVVEQKADHSFLESENRMLRLELDQAREELKRVKEEAEKILVSEKSNDVK